MGSTGHAPPYSFTPTRQKPKQKRPTKGIGRGRVRQPSKTKIGKQYMAHLEDSPGVLIASTHSGSMTQEIFFHFVNHFLES
jgi:hypothetical protein